MYSLQNQKDELNRILNEQFQLPPSFEGLESFNAPISVIWELTGKCASKCVYCSGGFPRIVTEMTRDEKVKLANELVSMKVFMVNLSGGDPMMSDDLDEIVEIFTSNDVNVMICTTGHCQDIDQIRRLCSNPLVAFNISIDSLDEEVNDWVRGKGSARAALSLLEKISSYSQGQTFVSIESVITRKNLFNFSDIVKLVEKYHIHEIRFQPVIVTNRTIIEKQLDITEEEIIAVKREIEELNKKRPQILPWIRFVDISRTLRNGYPNKLNWGAIITPEADLLLNVYIPFRFGNLRDFDSFSDAWNKILKNAWKNQVIEREMKLINNIQDIRKLNEKYGFNKVNLYV